MAIIPLRTVARARVRCWCAAMDAPAFRSARTRRKRRSSKVIRADSRAPVTSSFGRGFQPRTTTITARTRTLVARTRILEKLANRRDRNALREGRDIEREPVAIRDPRSPRKKAKRCSGSRAKYGACYVSRDDRTRCQGTTRKNFIRLHDILTRCSFSILHNGTRLATFPSRHRPGTGYTPGKTDHRGVPFLRSTKEYSTKLADFRINPITPFASCPYQEERGVNSFSGNRFARASSRQSRAASNATNSRAIRWSARRIIGGRHRYKRPIFQENESYDAMTRVRQTSYRCADKRGTESYACL